MWNHKIICTCTPETMLLQTIFTLACCWLHWVGDGRCIFFASPKDCWCSSILETVASHRLSRYRRRLRYRLGPKVSLVRILHFGSMIHYFLLLTNRSIFSCLDLGPCSEDSSSAATRLLGALHSKSSGVALQADRIPTHLGAASAVEPEEPRRSGDLWILFSFILQPGCPTTQDQIKIKCRSCC